MGQCQDVDIPRFVECLGSFQYLDATAQMAEMGSGAERRLSEFHGQNRTVRIRLHFGHSSHAVRGRGPIVRAGPGPTFHLTFRDRRALLSAR